MTRHRSAARALLFTATAITAIALPSHAQRAGDGFLFHAPDGSWTFRGGFSYATASTGRAGVPGVTGKRRFAVAWPRGERARLLGRAGHERGRGAMG